MKLFEVKEAVEGSIPQGILIFPDQDPPGIELGPEREKVLPLAPTHLRRLEAAIAKGYIPADAGIPLIRADLEPNSPFWRLTKERDHRDLRALVNVRVACGLNGQTRLTANAYDEELVQGRVERVYKDFEYAAGIVTVASVGADDLTPWPDLLLELSPGASFRVLRSGELGGRVPEFIVTWNGYKLRTIIPARFKNAGN